MTVSSTDSRADFSGDGTSTSFTIPFFFIADNDIEALLTSTGGTETVFVDGTEYTLSGKGVASGGELTLVSTDFVPATGEKLTIRRLEQFTQPTDLPVQGNIPSATLEEGYDRLTMLSQQLKEGQSRIMIAPAGESGVDLTLPSTGTRANKFLAYDGEAKPIASAGIAGSTDVPVSVFMEDVVAAVNASTALDILTAAGVDDANIFTKTQTWKHGSDIASAAALDPGDGNYFDVTGNVTITSILTKGVGTEILLQFDSTLVLTHDSTSLILPGSTNINVAAGDIARFEEYSTSGSTSDGNWRCTNYELADGKTVIADPVQATQAAIEAETNENTYIPPDLAKHSPGQAKAWVNFDGTVVDGVADLTGVLSNYNIISLVDVAAGIYTINIDTDFSGANYCAVGMAKADTATNPHIVSIDDSVTAGAGSMNVQVNNEAGTANDADPVNVAFFGDQ